MDLAVYRALSPVGGSVLRYEEDDSGTHAMMRLDSDVSSLLSVRVGPLYSPEVSLLSLREVRALIPAQLLSRPKAELEFRVYAQTRLEPGRPLLTSLGFGPRVELADPVTDALQRAHRFLLKSSGTDPWDRHGGGLLQTALLHSMDPDAVSRHLDIACDRYNERMSTSAPSRGPVVTRLTPLEVRSIPWQDADNLLGSLSSSSQLKTSHLSRQPSDGSVLLVRVENLLRGTQGTSLLQNALTV